MTWTGRRRRLRWAAAAIVVVVVAGLLLLAGGASHADPVGPVPNALPALGALDDQAVLMGSATAGPAGDAWAYRLLPPDVPPLSSPDGRRDFGLPRSAGAPGPQLAFLHYTDAQGAWQVEETPVDENGKPYRGFDPNRQSAQITAAGGGLLVGADRLRTGGGSVTVLLKDPGGRFTTLPDPGSTVLRPGSGGSAGEALALTGGTGTVAATAYDGPDGKTEAFFGALGPHDEDAVIHWDGAAWSRETVDVPSDSLSSFTILALGATANGNAWMLAQTAQSRGDGVVLFQRKVTGGTATWAPDDLGAPRFSAADTPASGIDNVAVLGGHAQPLTVTSDGLWIDGSLASSGATQDFTLYVSAATGQVTDSFCDARTPGGGAALCDHPLGFGFGGRSGYRSFAFPGPGVGTRIVTNPVDPGGPDDTNLGTYVRFDGAQIRRVPAGGGNGRPSGAFSAVGSGWLEGPVQIGAGAAPQALTSWPVSARSPFTAIATAPGATAGDAGAQAVAVGADGTVARYTPGRGWTREFLLTSSGAVSSPTLRAVAWPEAGRAYAVGDLGAMWLWRSETGLWEKDQAVPIGFDGNLQGVAFDPADPSRGYAVGRQGVLLRYDKTWTQEPLPDGFATTDFTQIAFAGSQALVVAGSDVLENAGAGWTVDPQVHDLMHQAGVGDSELFAVGALPDGGAVVAGRDVVIERDGPSSPWRMSSEPIPGQTAVAAAAYRAGDQVRAVVSVVPDVQYPPSLELPATDPNVPPPIVPPMPLPGDGYVLRETDSGWTDEERTEVAGTTADRPAKSDPIAAFALGPDGSGWTVGGWSGQADAAGRGTSVTGGAGAAVRRQVQTAGVYRYAPNGNAPAPVGASSAPVPLTAGVTTFAVAGHAECESACAMLASGGLGPDRNLAATLGEVAQLAGQPNGPQALLYTGGRTKPGGVAQSLLEGDRYAQLLGSASGLPVYPAVSAGDDPSVFQTVFAPFAAPFGTGAPPAATSTANIPPPSGAVGPGARTHYAFDTTGSGGAGVVRVVVIDNAAGSLAAADPSQNPSEPQAPWLAAQLADAKARGIPAIVMGSRDLNSHFTPAINVATDADAEAQVLRDGGASAYLFERPEENRQSTIPSGDPAGLPEFGTGTLGYRSPLTNTTQAGQPDSLFGDTGFLLASVDTAHRDPATNRAPVTVRLIPLIQDLSLNALDGTLLPRSRPALFQGLGRRPIAGDRWGAASADGSPNPPGANPYVQFPQDRCTQANCDSRIVPEFTFRSSRPDIADFVAQDPNSTNLRKPLQDTAGKVTTSASSGLLCAFNAGQTIVTIASGGFTFSEPVTVLGGAVQQPCGTRPKDPSSFTEKTSGNPSPPPASPAPEQEPSKATPPPPAPPPAARVPVPAAKAAPAAKKPSPPHLMPPPVFVPPVIVPVAASKPPQGGFVATPPPPPAASFGQPTPPGGATVRVFEEKREEEAAPEQSSAFSTYHADNHTGFPVGFLFGLILIAAFAGVSIRTGSRRRNHQHDAAVAAARLDTPPRHQTWRRP